MTGNTDPNDPKNKRKKASITGGLVIGLETFTTTTLGSLALIATLPFVLVADTPRRPQEERKKKYYHYTNAEGLAGILSTAKILPDAKGNVYITDIAMTAARAFQDLFLSQPTHEGKGDYVVAFYLDKNQESQLMNDPRHPLEYVWKNGTLKIDEVLWGAPNPFKN